MQCASHLEFDRAGLYTITLEVINQYDCADTALHNIYMMEGSTLYVPDAFTPNGDGENDIFFAYGTGIKTFEMGIYDRWGNIIYVTNDMTMGWDGMNNAATA